MRAIFIGITAVAAFGLLRPALAPASPTAPLRIAITLDDLPWSGSLPANESADEALQRIAAVLRVHDAPATGFVVCDDARDEQAIRSWINWGFELGNHSAAHSVDTSEWILARAYADALAAADGRARHAIALEFVRHVVAATEHASGVARRKLGRDVPLVLLLHANSLVTEHLDDLLLELRERGAEFITLEAALADPAYALHPPQARSRIVHQAIAPGAPSGLANAIDQASASVRMRSLLVMHRGRLVAEAYFNGAGPGTATNLKSVTKTVVSALVGVGLQQGWIESLDDPIAQYLPQRFSEERHSRQAAITIRQLLTMSSGLSPVDYGAIQQSPDWVAALLAQPVRQSEGAVFVYDTPALQLLSAVLQRASGRSLRDLANRELFGPLGGAIVYWRQDSQGLELGGNDAYLRPRDLVKLGELYRTGGVHEGRAILGSSFVRASATVQIRPAEPTINHGTLPVRGYGFLWWILDGELDGAYAALGHGGQVLLVSPRRELVVLMTSRWPSASSTDHYRHLARLLQEEILPLFPARARR